VERLRIFLCIDSYLGPTGGTERQVYLLAEGLVAKGHDVRLFVLRHSEYTRTSRDFPCSIECLEVHSMVSVRTLRRMVEFRARVRAEQPHAVHAFFNDSAQLMPLFAKIPGTRVFTSRRDMGFWYTAPKLRVLAVANRRVDGIICNSYAVAAEVRRREHFPGGKLIVIHNACPTPTHLGRRITDPAAVQRGDPGPRVCLIANLRPIKRIEDLIAAAAAVRKEVPAVQIRIVGDVGDDGYAEQLKAGVRSADLSTTIHFLPPTARPIEIIESSDIGVLTSQSEGFSNTLMEYMAGGLPVICSAVGGNPELVRHGIDGFVFEPGNVDELSRYMLLLARDAELRAEFGHRGMERVREFSMERMIQAHCEVYAGNFGNSLAGSAAAVDAPAPR
jgi:L-malate glycosyltransferase